METSVSLNGVQLAISDGGDKVIMHQSEYINKIKNTKIQKVALDQS